MNLLRALYVAWCARARVRDGMDEKGRGPEWRRGFADGRLAERAGAGPQPEETP